MTATTDTRWLLAIDSSSEQASLALSDGSRVAEVTWIAGRDQTATLLAEIDRLYSLMRTAAADLAAVAVATGPGMFNGLRVGLSVAKGFVLGLDVPLIGVSTLDVAAHPFATVALPIIPVVAAGRGRVVWAEYRNAQCIAPARNGTIDELASRVEALGPCLVTGELTADQAERVQAAPHVHVPPPSARLRRASSLAELAWFRYHNDDVDDAVALEPVYVHVTPER